MALTTLSNVKDFLQIDQNDTSRDNILNRLINAASSFVETFCKRTFAVTEYTDILDGTERRNLLLENMPIVTVESVTVNGDTVTPDKVENGSGMLVRVVGWRADPLSVIVTYTAGYETVPFDVEQAVIEMVALKFGQSIEESTGKTKQVQGGLSYEYTAQGLPPGIADILQTYVVRKV